MPSPRRKFVKKISYIHPVLGRTCYRLVNLLTGEEITPFSAYLIDKLQQKGKSPKNSVEAWTDDLSCFFDYFTAASEYLSRNPTAVVSSVLADILFAYPHYLTYGNNSENALARHTAEMTEGGDHERTTAARRLSTLRAFSAASARYQIDMQSMKELGLIDVDVTQDVFAGELLERKEIDPKQRQALIQRSMLAGVVRGGPKYIASDFFELPSKAGAPTEGRGIWADKGFPMDHILELFNNTRTYRDRALWALLAGTGIRTHEALNLQEDNIDGINESVFILPYAPRVALYGHADPKEREAIAFKGRSTVETYFLEPFKSIFFDSLKEYIRTERPPCDHDTIFVQLSNNARGRPMYLADAKSHNDKFKQAQEGMNLPKRYTLHSLRHFFGCLAHNYVQTEHGFGLDLETVKVMMGHESVATTEKYAERDRILIEARVTAFNRYISQHGFKPEIIRDQAIQHYKQQALGIAQGGAE